MRGAPLEEGLIPFIARGFNSTNTGVLQRVCKAWEMVQKKEKELRGSSNGVVGGYHRWLEAYAQGLDWLPKLRAAKEEEAEAPKFCFLSLHHLPHLVDSLKHPCVGVTETLCDERCEALHR